MLYENIFNFMTESMCHISTVVCGDNIFLSKQSYFRFQYLQYVVLLNKQWH